VRRYAALLVVMMVGVVGPACAKAITQAPAASRSPATVHADLTNDETTVALRIGDSLVLDLPLPPKGPGWTLLDWPKDILSPSPVVGGGPAQFPYTFIARQAGEGRIVAVNRDGCDGTRSVASPACVATPDLSQLTPELLFVLTVQVTP
jgi:hypothetical protein